MAARKRPRVPGAARVPRIRVTTTGGWIREWAQDHGYRVRRTPAGLITNEDAWRVPLARRRGWILAFPPLDPSDRSEPRELGVSLDGPRSMLAQMLPRLSQIPGLNSQFGWDARAHPDDGAFLSILTADWSDELGRILRPLRRRRSRRDLDSRAAPRTRGSDAPRREGSQ